MKFMILFSTAITLFFFQNCGSKVGFSNKDLTIPDQLSGNSSAPTDTSNETQDASVENDLVVALNDDIVSDINDPIVDDVPPQPPIVIDNTPTLDETVSFEACQEFIEVSDADLIVLPDRQNTSTCYFKRLMTAIPRHPSGSHGELRVSDVLAADHNGDHADYIGPYLLAESQFQIQNLRHWKIAISGSAQETNAPMKIDNFFLIQMTYGPTEARSEFVSAFGTADAEPNKTKPVLLNDKAIAFRSFAPGGTATVEALNLTPPQDVTLDYDGFYNLRFRALDCGGSANGSDVFAVFH